MVDYPKTIKRLLRRFASEAYERELHRELTRLDLSFTEWRNGTIRSGELNELILGYERGPSRQLFKRYNDNPGDTAVAYAIVTGILKREEIPSELLAALHKYLDYYQSLKDQNELREPDDFG